MFDNPLVNASRRVLVADDNAINLRVICMQIKKLGYEVDGVADGSLAVQAFERTPYGLILMDCQMPVLDGFQATAKIRTQEKEKNLLHMPILAFTADNSEQEAEHCKREGMDDVLPKPVKQDVLAEVLKKWIP